MLTHRKEIKPFDQQSGFRDINPLILNYVSTKDLLKTFQNANTTIVKDLYDFNVRRFFSEHFYARMRPWQEKYENFKKIIKLAKSIGIANDNLEGINDILASSMIDKKIYIEACAKYSYVIHRMIFLYILHFYPDVAYDMGRFDGDFSFSSKKQHTRIDLVSKNTIKSCIEHWCYTTEIDKDLVHAVLASELGNHLLAVHPDIIALNKLCSDRGGLLCYYLDRLIFYSHDYAEIIKITDECGKNLIQRLPVKAILKSLKKAAEYYEVDEGLIKSCIIYAYEKTLDKKLKDYSQDELAKIESFLLKQIQNADQLDIIQLIYDEHIHASYMSQKIIDVIQQKAFSLLNKWVQFAGLTEAHAVCEKTLTHAMFQAPSSIRSNIEKLLVMVEESLGNSRKRKYGRIL